MQKPVSVAVSIAAAAGDRALVAWRVHLEAFGQSLGLSAEGGRFQRGKWV